MHIISLTYIALQAVTWIDEGMVKRIRGVTFSTRVSVQFENTMIHAARGIFNRLLPDVHIFTDHKTGAQSGKYVIFQVDIMYYCCYIHQNLQDDILDFFDYV